MKTGLQMSVAALALAGALLFASAPARADSFGFRYGPRSGIGFSYESGGYCDSFGCPDDFWDYPVAYCPVYFDGEWYRGPFYYRSWQGGYSYWIHGDWRRDEWSGDRPDDACVDRFGPPLGYDFYISHGFIWRDEWRFRFFHHRHHGHDHDHDGDHDHDHHVGHDHGSWDHGGDHGRVWDHSGDHNADGGAAPGDQGGAATGGPAPLGGHPHEGGFGGRNGTGSTSGGAPGTNGSGPRDHFNGGGMGDHQPHDHGAPPPNDNTGRDSGGHHGDGGNRSAPPPPSSPAPSSPPPSSPPPSNGESHHDNGSRGDFGGHHTQTP